MSTGGPVDVSYLGSSCAGFATSAPDLRINFGGGGATLLRIKVKSTLAGTSSRFVNEPQIELRVWIDGNGTPLAVERDSSYSASFLFVKAGNVRKERWEIAVAGDRLYASHHEEENRATAIGKSLVSSLSVAYVPK